MQNELLLSEEVRLDCTAFSPSGSSGGAHKEQGVSGLPELAPQTVIFKMSVRPTLGLVITNGESREELERKLKYLILG